MRELNESELDTIVGGMCPCPGGGTQCPHEEAPWASNGNGAHWTTACGILWMSGGPVAPLPLQQ